MIKLGITGGISSGKSTAANYLASKESTYVFNADRESKKHLKSSSSLQNKLINVFSGHYFAKECFGKTTDSLA